jgi:hypothetical protein
MSANVKSVNDGNMRKFTHENVQYNSKKLTKIRISCQFCISDRIYSTRHKLFVKNQTEVTGIKIGHFGALFRPFRIVRLENYWHH